MVMNSDYGSPAAVSQDDAVQHLCVHSQITC